eukprot:gene20012-22746_t
MLSTVDCGSNSAPSSGDSANVGNHFEKKSERKDEFRAVNEQSYVYNYDDLHLRKGKWTVEEERYSNKVIEYFNNGILRLDEHERGITLRAYLAQKLSCDPMRITKKYTGSSCLGKRVYHAQK